MFLFRREKPGESSEPLRGRGGGRVRPRPQRKARRRRKMGMADFLMLGLIGGAVVFVIEIWLVHAPVIVALIYAIIVTIISAAFNAWLERRRAAKQPPPPKRRR